MPYIPNTAEDVASMLQTVGIGSIAELFGTIPQELLLSQPLNLPSALSELELTDAVNRLAVSNFPAGRSACFLGGGSYDHFIPAVVDAIASRGEFFTSYTPYQAEAAQGNLQALFEYQTLVTQLTGMDVSNSSLYDGGTAATEAVMMAMQATGRFSRIVTTASVHPEYRQILTTYLANLDSHIVTVDTPYSIVNPQELQAVIDRDTACVLIEHPNFFGCLEQVETIRDIAHRAGALVIAIVDPISLGLLRRPGDWGADIVVAEGQALGNPMGYGGPYLGLLACREQFLRRMPGRLVGQTVDRKGRRAWVLTMQTREQHIRREKATSNICTNQALMALRAAIYLTLMGPQGMREVAELCLQKAHYAAEQLTATGKLSKVFKQPFFKEFVLRVNDGHVDRLLEEAHDQDIFLGIPLARWYPELTDCLLIAVTEKRTKDEIDQLADLCAG